MRDAVMDDMERIIGDCWFGPVKDTTMASFGAKVDVCDLGERNRVFRWFMETIGPILTQ